MTYSTRRWTSLAFVLVTLGGLGACDGRDAANDTAPLGDTLTTAGSRADVADGEAAAPAAASVSAAGPRGKYGCIQTVPRMVNGSWEYEIEQRGFITLANGRYTDPYEVSGTYRHDAATDSTFFSGGILDGANATPMEDERLWVVIPVAGGRENRWTCGPA